MAAFMSTPNPADHRTGSLMYTMPRLARARMSHTTPRATLRHASRPPTTILHPAK